MSDLTKRMRERVCYASTNREWPNVELQEAANRIDALEEVLRELIDKGDTFGGELRVINREDERAALDKARALLEGE